MRNLRQVTNKVRRVDNKKIDPIGILGEIAHYVRNSLFLLPYNIQNAYHYQTYHYVTLQISPP